MKITGISGSPTAGGNNEKAIELALRIAEKYGYETEKLLLSKLNVLPCTDCGICKTAISAQLKALFDRTILLRRNGFLFSDEIGLKTVKDTVNMVCETLARFK